MARALIIGCGCRGCSLAGALVERGHAVRGTTREPGRSGAIGAVGAEAWIADPDRVGTLAPALAHVGVVCVLLGSAVGTDEQLAALHGTRLEMLLSRVLDTTVRGFVYEAAGSVDRSVLSSGAALVRSACQTSRIPYALLDADPREESWLAGAVSGVESVLSGAGGQPRQ